MNNFQLALQSCPKTFINGLNLEKLRQKDVNSQTTLMLVCQNDDLLNNFTEQDFASKVFKTLVEQEVQQTDVLKECALIKLLQCENPGPNHYKLVSMLSTETHITSLISQTSCQLAFRNYNISQFSERFQKQLEVSSQIKNYLKNTPGIELVQNKHSADLIGKYYHILHHTVEDSFNVYSENFMIYLLQFYFLHEAVINENQPEYLSYLLKKACQHRQLKRSSIYTEGQKQSGFLPQFSEIWHDEIKFNEYEELYSEQSRTKSQNKSVLATFGGFTYKSEHYSQLGNSKPENIKQLENTWFNYLRLNSKLIEKEFTNPNILRCLSMDEKIIYPFKELLNKFPIQLHLLDNIVITIRRMHYLTNLFPKNQTNISLQKVKPSIQPNNIDNKQPQDKQVNVQQLPKKQTLIESKIADRSIYHYYNLKETISQLASQNLVLYNEFLCFLAKNGYYFEQYDNLATEFKYYTHNFMNSFPTNFKKAFQDYYDIYLDQETFKNEQIGKNFCDTFVYVIKRLPQLYLKPYDVYHCLINVSFDNVIPDWVKKSIIRQILILLGINICFGNVNLGMLVGIPPEQLQQLQKVQQ